jgi:hypothetical protein
MTVLYGPGDPNDPKNWTPEKQQQQMDALTPAQRSFLEGTGPSPMGTGGGWFKQREQMWNPVETGVARKLNPQEATQYYLDNPDRMTKPGMQSNPYPAGSPQWIAEAQMRSGTQAPIGQAPPPAQSMSPMGAPASTASAAFSGLSSPAGMMGGMFGGGGSPSQGGTLNSMWQASQRGMAQNQPAQPFSGQAPQPQRTSSFGMPQQSTAGTGSGYRRMRAPTGEERDIHESQAQHFLSRGGKWA